MGDGQASFDAAHFKRWLCSSIVHGALGLSTTVAFKGRHWRGRGDGTETGGAPSRDSKERHSQSSRIAH